MMPGDASETYENWRRLWLSGGDSTAIAALCFHGLRGALAIAGGACSPSRSQPAPTISSQISIADAVITEAASQVRHLLRSSSRDMNANRKDRESRHV